ncbi:redoxin domain-containing protein [Leptolyngbya sp. 15MV]|nr:redoxin domain-containing protein [Leptolyngbya sp. 15MV]
MRFRRSGAECQRRYLQGTKGKVYVVEFWATWCGPCIASIPHLSELQNHHRKDGLTIIGVTSRDPNNSLDDVKQLVTERGDGISYHIAWDTERKTYTAYMTAARQRGIPTSFVVDKAGNIAYIGHPMWLDLPVKGAIDGTWDAEKGKAQIAAAERRLGEMFSKAESDPKAALVIAAELEKDFPAAMAMFDAARYGWMLEAGDPGASAFGRKVMAKAIAEKNASGLNELAWGLVDPEAGVKNPDLDLAYEAATKAVQLSGEKDAAILDTLARVYFVKGDLAKAIEWQTKAVAQASGPMKAELEKVLKEYQSKR